MYFLPKTANLQVGDTHKEPKNTQFSKSRHTPEGKGPPCDITHKPTCNSQTLSIISNQNTHRPPQKFLEHRSCRSLLRKARNPLPSPSASLEGHPWLYLEHIYLEGAGKLLRQNCSQDPEKHLKTPRRHNTMSRGKIWLECWRGCDHLLGSSLCLRENLRDGGKSLCG
jgi:hypothetical protein